MVAARLWRAGRAAAAELSLPVDGHPEYNPVIADIRARLAEASFVAADTEGQAMSREQAIAYTLSTDDGPPTTDHGPQITGHR